MIKIMLQRSLSQKSGIKTLCISLQTFIFLRLWIYFRIKFK